MSKESAARWIAIGATCLFGATACQTSSPANPSLASNEKNDAVEQVQPDSDATARVDTGLKTIYFDYDRWELRADAQRTLRENAQKIQANPDSGMITIEGHADERGSEEYNLALGERRATAVERYLRDLGVSDARMQTVSFGENRPAVQGHDDSAWRYNRRSEIRIDSRTAAR